MAGTNKIDGLVNGTNAEQKGNNCPYGRGVRADKGSGADLPLELQNELERLQQQFHVDRNQLKQISERFQQELEEGVSVTTANGTAFLKGP